MQHCNIVHWKPNHTGQRCAPTCDQCTRPPCHWCRHPAHCFPPRSLLPRGSSWPPRVALRLGSLAHWSPSLRRGSLSANTTTPLDLGHWHWLGVSGGWENQVDVRLSWGFLLLPRPQICCSAPTAVVHSVLKNTAVFTTGWDIFFSGKASVRNILSPSPGGLQK